MQFIALWASTLSNTLVIFITKISQHLSVKYTLQQMADYGNISKYAQIRITQYTAAPAMHGVR